MWDSIGSQQSERPAKKVSKVRSKPKKKKTKHKQKSQSIKSKAVKDEVLDRLRQIDLQIEEIQQLKKKNQTLKDEHKRLQEKIAELGSDRPKTLSSLQDERLYDVEAMLDWLWTHKRDFGVRQIIGRVVRKPVKHIKNTGRKEPYAIAHTPFLIGVQKIVKQYLLEARE